MRALANAGVRLNVRPTSNVELGRVNSLQARPIRVPFDAGVVVTINADDPLIFDCTLSGEFLALYEAGVTTAQELEFIRAAARDWDRFPTKPELSKLRPSPLSMGVDAEAYKTLLYI